jgi:hypothetical protein
MLEESNLFEFEKIKISSQILKLQNKFAKHLETNDLSCSFCHLAVSCGDRVCDKNSGETKENCFEDCTEGLVRSYNGQTICGQVKNLFTPNSETEVQNIIKKAISEGKHIKVIGRKHSDNGEICTDGISIATDNLNKIFGIEFFEGEETVRVGPGATVFEVNEWLHLKNRSIGFAVPSYRSVTVGGVISNAVHGSSPFDNSILSSIVTSVKMVTADGQIKEFSEKTTSPELFKAIRVNLGLLGIITEIRLKIVPQFKLEVQTTYLDDEKLFKNKTFHSLYEECDWVQLHWFPNAESLMRSCGKISFKPVDEGASNKLIGESSPDFLFKMIKVLLQYGSDHPWVYSFIENFRWINYLIKPPFEIIKDGKPQAAKTLVGHSHMLQASEYSSNESRFLRTRDFELAIPYSQMVPALSASKKYFTDNDISLPLTGLFIRFSEVDEKTFLSLATEGGKFKLGTPAMYLELTYFKPAGLNQVEMEKFETVYANWAKLMVSKFNARVHWAKNKPIIFSLERSLGNFQDNLDRFQNALNIFDPKGLFSNEYGKGLGFTWKEGN